ncbi:hypothetical protein [Actinocorallia sp. A-T 12471]|uniref:hypothetical protein n=1 Tax=Actinocorallia sp. A-T 12471 TaxID=3089813 RepID=UPI0029D28A10|nr:hypothetical protein [Actinocorallia sp. A-T 12471]MDX6738666.1 hypothetical protein [Actinocorallia sp. A-T 12471]
MMKARFLPPIALISVLIPSGVSCSAAPPSDSGAFNPSGTKAPQAAPAAPLPTAPTVTKAEADKIVLDRYRLYQKTYEQAYATGDPTPLADVATDPLLTIITKDVTKTHNAGHIWRFRNLLNPKIQKRSSNLTKIAVIDCIRTLGAFRFSAKTGKRTGGTKKSTTFGYSVIFVYDGTTWNASEAKKGKPC